MAKVNAIKCLEDMNEEGLLRRATDTPTPGIVLNLVTVAPSPAASIAPVISGTFTDADTGE